MKQNNHHKSIKLIYFASILIIFAISLSAVSYAATQLQVSLSSYKPAPASRGQYLDVWVKIYNAGTQPAKNVALNIIQNAAFIPVENTTTIIGEVKPGESALVKFRVIVSRDAVEGINYLEVNYSSNYPQGPWTKTRLPVEVITSTPTLIIKKIYTSPEKVPQGQKVTLTLMIGNEGSTLLKDILIKVDVSNTIMCSQTCEIISNPFFPTTSTVKRLATLLPGRSSTIQYSFIVDPEADSGLYKLPINISYLDEAGAKHSFNEQATFIIASKPILTTTFEGITIKKQGIEPIISISNKGLEPVKRLSVKILSIEGAKLIMPLGEIYIGNIDPDDDASFKPLIKPIGKNIKLNLKYTYLDSLNNKYEENATVSFSYEPQTNKTWLFVFIILVIIVAIYFYNRRKKKKK